MKWVGLTGGIATGKSTVGKILRDEFGFPVISADELAHEALIPGTAAWTEIQTHLGPKVLDEKGQVDRRKLGQVVFKDPKRLRWLESLIHPEVQKKTRELRAQLQKQGVEFAFYDVPLLFEKGLQDQFDCIVVVSAARGVQKTRMQQRDGLSLQEIEDRLSRQWPIEDKVEKADFVIENHGDFDQLKGEVSRLINFLRSNPTTNQ